MVIMHNNPESGVLSVCYPLPMIQGDDLLNHAKAIVPSGVPFWITSDINADREYRDAWVLDTESMGEPTGYGERE